MRFIKSFPVLSAGVVQAAIALAIALGLHLSPVQTGAIEATAAAVLAVIVAAAVRPFEVSVLGGLLVALGTLLVAFKVKHVTAGDVSAVYALFAALMAAHVHSNVSPVAPEPRGPIPAE